uniref:GST C-terminal domain-containing protein n=1 Tax=Clastoptera arizonana TaxID=38151 RepID=A0A1B6CHL2_9HEMI
MDRYIENHMPSFNLELRDIICRQNNVVTDNDKIKIRETYSNMEKLLEGQDWFADVHMTIVDFSYIAALTTFIKYVPISEKEYPRISSWMKRCKQNVQKHKRGINTVIDESLTNLVMAAIETTPPE